MKNDSNLYVGKKINILRPQTIVNKTNSIAILKEVIGIMIRSYKTK